MNRIIIIIAIMSIITAFKLVHTRAEETPKFRGAWGSVVNRNSKFSSQILAVVYVGISAQMFSVKWQ